MKTFVVVVLLGAALTLSGCAARTRLMQEQVASANQQVTLLKAELEVLKLQAAAPKPVAPQPIAMPTPVASAPRMMPPDYVPPPHAPNLGPPEDWAWMYERPAGCSGGPLSLVINNTTNLFVKVFIDGKELKIRGAYGRMPHLPPGGTGYVCLDRPGRHRIAGVGYTQRYSQLVEVDKFDMNMSWKSLSGSKFDIENSDFYYY